MARYVKLPALVIYTAKRLLVLGLVLAVCYLLGLRGLWLIVVALLGSGAISLLLLNKDRDRVSVAVFDWSKRLNARMNSAAQKEDAILDALYLAEQNEANAKRDSEGEFSQTREAQRFNRPAGEESTER